MLPPPPRPTLFPYTTLFRSVRTESQLKEALAAKADHLLLDNLTPEEAKVWISKITGRAKVELSGGITDRKSTRLNSSHRCISYAVFCLKKKKKKRHDLMIVA